MTQINVLNRSSEAAGGYKVDVNRGDRNGRASSEWCSRPADERFLSLSELYASVNGSAAVRVEASRDDAERLALVLPGSDAPVAPTHWTRKCPSGGQYCERIYTWKVQRAP